MSPQSQLRLTSRLTYAGRVCIAVTVMTAAMLGLGLAPLSAVPRFESRNALQGQQQAPATRARFEVASVRSCDGDGGRGTGPASGPSGQSPGTLYMNCQPLKLLIQMAYDLFATGQGFAGFFSPQSQSVPITGGPDWINSARYTINAKAEGVPSGGMMQGPMLQTLLEDRFKLKIRRETREIPVYALTVAASGFKLKPLPEGSCVPRDSIDRSQIFTPGAPQLCGLVLSQRVGGNTVLQLRGMSISDLSKNLGWNLLGMPVVDKTGITGLFDFRVEFAPDENTAPIVGGPPRQGDPPATAPFIVTAIQEQLGLKLERSRGPGDSLVIEHIERPSEN